MWPDRRRSSGAVLEGSLGPRLPAVPSARVSSERRDEPPCWRAFSGYAVAVPEDPGLHPKRRQHAWSGRLGDVPADPDRGDRRDPGVPALRRPDVPAPRSGRAPCAQGGQDPHRTGRRRDHTATRRRRSNTMRIAFLMAPEGVEEIELTEPGPG